MELIGREEMEQYRKEVREGKRSGHIPGDGCPPGNHPLTDAARQRRKDAGHPEVYPDD